MVSQIIRAVTGKDSEGEAGYKKNEIAEIIGVHRVTLYRHLKNSI